MKLLTVGDSFTYGEELADPPASAWPTLLANRLGYELTNLARPGSGNTRMVRQCVEHAKDYDLIIVAWSHFARIEMADEAGFYDLWPGGGLLPHKGWADWRWTIIDYFTKHYNDDYLYRQYLLYIILVQKYLQSIDKPYLMLDGFDNHQNEGRTKASNKDLLDQVDNRYYVGWPNETMVEWAYMCKLGPKLHFLDDGHIKIYEKVYNHMQGLGWTN